MTPASQRPPIEKRALMLVNPEAGHGRARKAAKVLPAAASELGWEVEQRETREAGHEVYDFRNPSPGNFVFHWSEINHEWEKWSPNEFKNALQHSLAKQAFRSDFEAMKWADTCVMVMPCGRSAHLEAGWFVGAGKLLFILLSDGEPELMYNMANGHSERISGVIDVLEAHAQKQILMGREAKTAGD